MNDFRLSKDVLPSRYELRFELDLDDWRSVGRARIALRIGRPTREIVLHAVGLDVHAGRVVDGPALTGATYDAESETATLRFDGDVPAGDRVLELEWRGEISSSLRGLYRSTRGDERYAATQFEAADARRAFPCFDEPEFKARFAIELVHPTGLTAIGNMAIEHQDALADGRTLTRFRETPPISSYLVAFTLGPYESTEVASTASGVPVRVWLPQGMAQQGMYAREAHVRSLEWLEAYTAIPYPYGKLDAIGIPDFEAGAMENPGAITYRLRYLAADERNASIGAFKAVFSVAAHELTHMWWGDLVTMRWWTDLWLNESLASFVGEMCTAELNPEWRYWRDFVDDAQSAFGLDALASTHPVSVEAKSAEEATQRFDAISYTKGACVLRMIEGYLGAEAFREGIRIYLRRHAESNASADDFWKALDEASSEDVTGVLDPWIKQPGHPLVHIAVQPTADGLRLELAQERYFSDPDAKADGHLWPIPLVLECGGRQERVLLRKQRATVDLPGARWVFPNAGGRGFYRYALDERGERMLDAAVSGLAPEERLSLVQNQWALARSGKVPLSTFMRRLESLRGEEDRTVLGAIAGALGWLDSYAVQPSTERGLAELVDNLYRPILDQAGWTPREGEDGDTREKRATAIRMLGDHARAADVRAEARRRVAAHLDGTERLHPDVAGAVIAVAATEGDGALWDRYAARMTEVAATDAQEESRFRGALAAFEDPALVRRTAEALFSPLIRPMDRGLVVGPLLHNRHARAIAWPIVRDAWDEHVTGADPFLKQRFVGSLAQLAQRDLAPEAGAFLEAKRSPDVDEIVARTLERLRVDTAAAERLARELEDALLGTPAR